MTTQSLPLLNKFIEVLNEAQRHGMLGTCYDSEGTFRNLSEEAEELILTAHLGPSNPDSLKSAAQRLVDMDKAIKANPHYIGEEWEQAIEALEKVLNES